MIVEIEAKFACDDCGTEFIVPLDPARKCPADWSVFDVAEDFIRGGVDCRDGTGAIPNYPSVDDDGRHYCHACSMKRGEE